MGFNADLVSLVLYCAQQLGVTLAVGAETIMLGAYLIAMRDRVVDEKESQYSRAIKRVLNAALVLIIASGLIITALHVIAGQSPDPAIAQQNKDVLFSAAYLFKWVLVALAVGLTAMRHTFSKSSIVEGVIGGTWYAVFLVHILAPITTWTNLLSLYGMWLVGFAICWEVLALSMRDRKGKPLSLPLFAAKKVAPPPPAQPAPPPIVVPPPAPMLAPTPTPPVPPPVHQVETKITMAPASTFVPPTNAEALPAKKVTDTPFLPQVPPLQPIPTSPEVPMPAPIPAPIPAPMPPPAAPPAPPAVAPAPAPAPDDASSMAIHVMPKSASDIK